MNYCIISFLCCNSIQAVSVCFSQLIINNQLMLLNKKILFLACFWSRRHSTPALTECCLIATLQCEVLHATHNKSWQWWQETMINRPVYILSSFLLFLLVLDFLSYPDSWITVVIQSPIFFYRLLFFFSIKFKNVSYVLFFTNIHSVCLMLIYSQTPEFMCTKVLSCFKKILFHGSPSATMVANTPHASVISEPCQEKMQWCHITYGRTF